MPKVAGKEFPYTKAGKKSAKKARQKMMMTPKKVAKMMKEAR